MVGSVLRYNLKSWGIKMSKNLHLVLICAAAILTGCGNYSDSCGEELSKSANSDINTKENVEVYNQDESSSLPDKESFSKISSEISQQFNYFIKVIDEKYPITGDKRLYGYLGSNDVEGEVCYNFTVYDVTGSEYTKVVNGLVNFNCDKVYEYDEINLKYLQIDDDNGSNWSEKVTDSFAGYFSDLPDKN